MPTTNINQRVKRIANLQEAELNLLVKDGIVNEDDLGFIKFEDLNTGISIVNRRKIELVTKFLNIDGNSLAGTTTIVKVESAVMKAESMNSTNYTSGTIVDADRGAPKVYTDPLPSFSGDPVDYEEWERNAGATIRQTVYKKYLTRAATSGDSIEEARSG